MGLFVHYSLALIIALIVTVITTPIVKRIALKYNIVDIPNDPRKIHTRKMPYLGGVAIALGFVAGFIYLQPNLPSTWAFLAGGFVILATGIIDDKVSLPARYKMLGQILAALIVVFSGVTVDFIQFPVIGRIEFGWWQYPITIVWIVGITNAINFIDGLDGLAGGVSSIALGSTIVMGILEQQTLAIALSVILLGATIGFLFFNSYPAKIFMGDSGAMFIGYTMAYISIIGLFKSFTIFSLIIPIIILAVPIFDTSFAIVRRILRGQKNFHTGSLTLTSLLIKAWVQPSDNGFNYIRHQLDFRFIGNYFFALRIVGVTHHPCFVRHYDPLYRRNP